MFGSWLGSPVAEFIHEPLYLSFIHLYPRLMASAREFKSSGAGREYRDSLVPAHGDYRRRDSPDTLDPQTELTRIAVMLRNQVDQTRTLLADIRQTSQRYKVHIVLVSASIQC